jgi:hypothetical protein
MTSTPRELLASAVARILRPLIRILLRNGISYGTFADMAKREFVDLAAREFSVTGRKQTVSRIAVLTGLTRKEVKRLSESGAAEDRAAADRYQRAARVVAGWRRDHDFLDRRGAPAVLPITGTENSFQELVRRYSGDIPYRAVLDQLIADGSAAPVDGQRIRLTGRAYVPSRDATMKLHILGVDTAFLIDTIGHNIDASPAEARFQRKVMYDNLPDEALERFRRLSSRASQRLLETLDDWLSRHDRDSSPDAAGTGRNVAGIGVYYFEAPTGEREKNHEDEL